MNINGQLLSNAIDSAEKGEFREAADACEAISHWNKEEAVTYLESLVFEGDEKKIVFLLGYAVIGLCHTLANAIAPKESAPTQTFKHSLN